MGWLTVLGLLLIIGTLIVNAIVIVPTVHFGQVLRFKRRTGRILKEGLHFVVPFIDSVELFKSELVTTDVGESFFSKDNLEIMIKGSVQWRPDEALLDSTFVEMSENTITKGLVDTIKSELGIIAGTKKGEAFIKDREAISLLINSVLRLSAPPHIAENLSPAERLQYYIDNTPVIRKRLADEPKNVNDRSDLENLYGIDIIRFSLADVDFSQTTKAALEKKKQAEAEMKAAQERFQKKKEIIEQLKSLGIDADAALDSAEVATNEAEKKIYSIPVLKKIIPRIFLTGGK